MAFFLNSYHAEKSLRYSIAINQILLTLKLIVHTIV